MRDATPLPLLFQVLPRREGGELKSMFPSCFCLHSRPLSVKTTFGSGATRCKNTPLCESTCKCCDKLQEVRLCAAECSPDSGM